MTASAAQRRAETAAAAVRYHYDIGNEFYQLWLDPTLTYSCAMPNRPDDTLEAAQQRKLRYHLDAVRAGASLGHGVLDIGCGWGSLLRELSITRQVRRSG